MVLMCIVYFCDCQYNLPNLLIFPNALLNSLGLEEKAKLLFTISFATITKFFQQQQTKKRAKTSESQRSCLQKQKELRIVWN